MSTVIFFVWLASAGFSAFIAYEKNRNIVVWGMLGLFFGIFAFLAIMAVDKLPKTGPIEILHMVPNDGIEDAVVIPDPSLTLSELDQRIQNAMARAGM